MDWTLRGQKTERGKTFCNSGPATENNTHLKLPHAKTLGRKDMLRRKFSVAAPLHEIQALIASAALLPMEPNRQRAGRGASRPRQITSSVIRKPSPADPIQRSSRSRILSAVPNPTEYKLDSCRPRLVRQTNSHRPDENRASRVGAFLRARTPFPASHRR